MNAGGFQFWKILKKQFLEFGIAVATVSGCFGIVAYCCVEIA